MDPVSLVVGAMAAGALAGTSQVAGTAVQDAYDALREMVRRRLGGSRAGEVLEAQDVGSQLWQARLSEAVVGTGIEEDADALRAAQRLMALLDATGAAAGKYTVDLRGAQGVQVGDDNTQHNQF